MAKITTEKLEKAAEVYAFAACGPHPGFDDATMGTKLTRKAAYMAGARWAIRQMKYKPKKKK